tara:strand:- start:1983 stop:2279 length:297 start_codon:yes stop_codon:yes gene_type:complete
MIVLFKHKWNRRLVRVAAVYTLLTTLLMLIALATTNNVVPFIGIIVLLSYLPITGILIILQFINVMRNSKDIQEHTMTLILVLLNYPLGFLYIYLLNP